MSEYFVVEVTADDIERGRSGSDACPIARAVARACPGYRVHVFSHRLVIAGRAASLTQKAERFIAAFDAKRPVRPQRFRLPYP